LILNQDAQQVLLARSARVSETAARFIILAKEAISSGQSEALMMQVKALVEQFKHLTKDLKQIHPINLETATEFFDKALTDLQTYAQADPPFIPESTLQPVEALINEVENWQEIETPKEMIASMLNITESVSRVIPTIDQNGPHGMFLFSTANSLLIYFMKMKILACLNVLEANEEKLNQLLLTTAVMIHLLQRDLLVDEDGIEEGEYET